jgi:predicted alpha/beta hydrolase
VCCLIRILRVSRRTMSLISGFGVGFWMQSFRPRPSSREACARYHTALGIISLEGQVPERKVKGEPVDISPMAEYAWYEWVKFRDTSVNFADSNIQLDRDLGAAIDIFSAMACKVLN